MQEEYKVGDCIIKLFNKDLWKDMGCYVYAVFNISGDKVGAIRISVDKSSCQILNSKSEMSFEDEMCLVSAVKFLKGVL